MELSQDQISILRDYFINKPVKAVYLFGSYARGDADGESDIDLILEIDLNNSMKLGIIQYKIEIKALLFIKADIYLEHRILKYAKKNIWKERVLIYQKI